MYEAVATPTLWKSYPIVIQLHFFTVSSKCMSNVITIRKDWLTYDSQIQATFDWSEDIVLGMKDSLEKKVSRPVEKRIGLLLFTGDRTRTDTESPPIDFESIVSTNFTTPAWSIPCTNDVHLTLSGKKTQYHGANYLHLCIVSPTDASNYNQLT